MRKYLFTRRALLFSGIAVASFSAVPVTQWFEKRRFFRRVEREFAEIFGAETLTQDAAQQFLEDYKNVLLAKAFIHSPENLAQRFLQSSNFLEYHQAGGDLDYDGMFDPYLTPCNNHLAFSFDFPSANG